MLRLLGLAISIGIADSLNPSTIGPALYIASGRAARRQVVHFTAGVFCAYLLGGALLLLGPGQLLLSIFPHPSHRARYVIEIVIGGALMMAAMVLWRFRRRLVHRDAPQPPAEGKSTALLGVSIVAVELPTAFPYFALIAALIGSGINLAAALVLLLVFNVLFITPLLGIIGLLTFAKERSVALLERARSYLNDHWPQILAIMLALAGVFVLFLGISGLTYRHHNAIGRIARGFRRLVAPFGGSTRP